MGKSKTVDTPAAAVTTQVTDKYDGKKTEDHKTIDNNYNSGMKTFTEKRDAAVADMVRGHRDLRMQNNSANYKNKQAIAEYTINNGLKNSGYRSYLEDNEKSRYSRMTEAIDKSESDANAQIEEAFEAGVNELGEWKETAKSQVTEHYDSMKEQELDYLLDPDRLTVDEVQVASASGKNDAELKSLYESGNLNIGSLFRVLGVDTAGYEDYLINGMNYEDLKEFAKQIKSQSTLTSIGYDLNSISQGIQEVFNIYNGRYFDDDGNLKEGYRGDGEAFFSQLNEKLLPSEEQLKKIKQQLEEYTKEYGSNESVKDLIEYVDGVLDSLSKIKEFVSNDIAYMKQFKSEEEYLRYTAYNAIGKRLTYDNILAEIKRLGDLQKTQDPDKAAGTQKIRDDLNGLLYSADYKDNASFDKAIADLERQIVDLEKKWKAEKDSETKKIWDRKLNTAKDRKEILIKKYADWKKSGQMRAFGMIQDMPEFREFAEEGANAVLFDTNGSFFDIASSYEAESRKGTWYEGDDYSEKFQDQNFVAIFQKILEKIPSDQREKLLNGQITIYDVDTDGDGKADLGINSCPRFDRFMSDIINDGRLMGVPHSDGDGERDKINVFIGEMTEQEMEIYNAYFAMSGVDAANKYLAYLVEGVPTVAEQYLPDGSTKPKNNGLNMRKAEREYEKIKDSKFKKVAFGIEAGLDSWENGFLEFLDGCDSEYVPITAKQYQAGLVTDSLGEGSFARVLFDVNTSIGNMLPSIIASTAVSMLLTPAGGFATLGTAAKAVKTVATAQKVVGDVGGLAGSALTGMASAGNAYQEAKRLGYDDDQAKNYALMTGAVEGGMQYLLSGISSLGGGLTGNIISNAASKINNGIARVAFKLGGRMAGEGFEEYLQEVSGSVIKNLTLGTAHDLDLFSGDAFYAAFLGAITCGLLEGVDTVRSDHAESAARTATDALFDQARAMPEGSKAHKMATELYDSRYNLDKNQIQALVDEIGIESKNAGQRFYNATADALKRFGETGSIKNIATAATALMQGAQLTDAQMKLVADSKLNEMVAKVDSKTGEVTFEAVSGTETKPRVDLNTDGDSVVESFKSGVDGKTDDVDNVIENEYYNIRGEENDFVVNRRNEQGFGRSKESRIIKRSQVRGVGKSVNRETKEAFKRRTHQNAEGIRKEGTLLEKGKLSFYFVPTTVDDSNGGKTVQKLLDTGVRVFYCNGPIEINNGENTVSVSTALTMSDGTVFVSDMLEIPFDQTVSHEIVHVMQNLGGEAYYNYDFVLCSNIDLSSQNYLDIAKNIYIRHYLGEMTDSEIESRWKTNAELNEYIDNAVRNVNDVHFESIIREIAAYINQYIQSDFDVATRMYSDMFFDWDAVVEANKQFNENFEADLKEAAFFMPENGGIPQKSDVDDILAFKSGVSGEAVGDGRQLNSVSGEAGSKDSAFSLPEISGESAVSGVDDAFYNNLTVGLRGEKDVGFDGEAEAPIGELSENVDENIDKNSENFEKDLENGQNGEYNKNKGSVDGALEGLELLNSYNMGLESERHPVTNIYFKRMETVVNGVRYAVVMPCFDSKYKAALLPNQFLLSDKRQFLIADKQLKLAVESNPEVAKQFTEAELKQIKKGRRPSGYTWHHAAEPGSLELVDSKLHNKTGHTGGRYFWGGGSKYR